VVKLLLVLGLIVTLSLARHPILILAVAALTLGWACLLPARELLSVLRPALGAAALALLLFLPAMLLLLDKVIVHSTFDMKAAR
jgi:cobalt/nickel transport system permease protein